MHLNPSQALVVATREKRLLVLAGAGTGKTATSVHWVADIIRKGTPRSAVLMITFTRKAATEMATRVERLISSIPKKSTHDVLNVGTYHAIASILLRQEAEKFGLLNRRFSTLDESEAQSIWKSALKQCSVDPKSPLFSPGKLHARYSLARNTCADTEALMADTFGGNYMTSAMRVVRTYEELKRAANVVDYDDLLVLWAQRMHREPEYAAKLRARWKFVLVDEMQDNNKLNQLILDGLNPEHLLVVGDANQSIYGFRGSDVSLIVDFPRRNANAKILKLEDNYRSGQAILDLANEIVSREQAALTLHSAKTSEAIIDYRMYLTPQDEANGVVGWVKDGVKAGNKAIQYSVLSRSSRTLTALEVALNFHQIPYKKYGGLTLADSAEVKDFISFLRVAHNPHDRIAILRALTQFPGIGEGTAAKAIAAQTEGLFDKTIWPGAAAAMPEWLEDFHKANTLGEMGRMLQERIRPLILANYPKDAEDRLGTINALVNSMDKLNGSLETFLDGFTIDRTSDSFHPDTAITISTIHSAKGLEWDNVWLIGAGSTQMPHPRAQFESELSEERRLLYVAVTRARTNLVISYSSENDRRQGQTPCRMLPPKAPWKFSRAEAGLQNRFGPMQRPQAAQQPQSI
jgi:DNA helicase II / ATP-dependent DNA helicase PcrA